MPRAMSGCRLQRGYVSTRAGLPGTETEGRTMSDTDPGVNTIAAFRSFVERLDADPQGDLLLAQLEHGHEPDHTGWCRHPLHMLTSHPERHPCSTAQLVTMIREGVAPKPNGST